MKKFYSLWLMAVVLLISANTQAETVNVGTYAELKTAIGNAQDGDEIQLTADINYGKVGYASNLNITKSITLNGQGHTLKGAGERSSGHSHYATVWVNLNGTNDVDVVFKDINIINDYQNAYNDMAIQTRGKLRSLTLQNVYLESYSVPLQIGGTHANQAYTTQVTIEDSHLKAKVYYPILSWNNYNLVANNTTFEGWCSLYFKGVSSSTGSRGSVIVANNCQFNAPNVHSGKSNAFGMFVCEDDGISITLNNCSMDAVQLGDQSQSILVLSEYAAKARRTQPVSLTINGDNTYINGSLLTNNWANGMYTNANYQTDYTAPIPNPFPLSVTISGGTYAFNPAVTGWLKNETYETEEELLDPSNIQLITIPDGYEVKEIETQQGDVATTLYRVRKTITTSYSINEDVEGEGAGQNEHTEFLISADETVAAESTVANYVEVSDNATLTVPAGKDLVVTNGLDVTSGAQVKVEAGSTLVVGEGGVTTESTESIEIGADENGSASFLLSPDVIVNTTPNLTIKMLAEGVGMQDVFGTTVRHWHRFALPITAMANNQFEAKAPNYPTAVKSWDYTTNTWGDVADLRTMEPFYGYMLSTTQPVEDVTYTFKGQLVGNQNSTIQFAAKGYNFFGNSYTGYISVLNLVDMLVGKSNIEGTVWLWNGSGYTGVPLLSLQESPEDYAGLSEVAPMQTFVLRLRSNDLDAVDVNYAEAIWGNPRYSAFTGVAAPALRGATSSDKGMMDIIVTDMEGHSDVVRFMEKSTYTDSEDRGYDASKLMNNGYVQMYSTVSGENYSTVASDNLAGKKLSIRSLSDYQYTITFAHVRGLDYALRDNVTGAVTPIVEGNMYSFVAQPNSTAAGRFEIVPVRTMPTAVENADVAPVVKGIYSMQGQYLGDDLNVLPAGVYVVDGVRIVK